MKIKIIFLLLVPLQLLAQSPNSCEDALPADADVYVNEFHLGCVDVDDRISYKAKDASGDVITGVLLNFQVYAKDKIDINAGSGHLLNLSRYGPNVDTLFFHAVIENTSLATPGVVIASVQQWSPVNISLGFSGFIPDSTYDLIWETRPRGQLNGKEDIASGASTVTVNISIHDYSSGTPTFIQASTFNIIDSSPGVIGAMVTAKSGTSITFDLSGQTDSANYDLLWEAHTGGRYSGITSIGSGVTSIAVDITSYSLAESPLFVQAVIENITDSTPGVIFAGLEAKTSTTLTFDLSGQTDTANYDIVWEFKPYFEK